MHNTKKSLRIIFMGTPEFAVHSLQALVEAKFEIVGVVTAPDKPAGRGMQLQESAVKKYAVKKGLIVLQPEKLKNSGFLEQLRSLEADLQVVVAFRMLPEIVWNMPSMGSINLHSSLLPQYRGAAPINWAIINGEQETGVTTFKLKHEIDTGDILLQEAFPVGENDTLGEVHDRMKEIGAQLLVKTIKGLEEGRLNETPQEKNEFIRNGQPNINARPLHHAPKIFTETCKINFNKSVEEVHNLIRGLSPFPGAFTHLKNKTFKIYKSKKEPLSSVLPGNVQPGDYETDGKSFLKFACSNGYVHCLEIQLEGKKKMDITEFLRGFRA